MLNTRLESGARALDTMDSANRGRLSKARRAAVTALASIGALVVLVTFTPALRWWSAWLVGGGWEIAKGDVLVVLSADGDNAQGTMGYSSYWRAVHAVDAWREGGFERMIISGSGTSGSSIQSYVVSHGVPESATVLEGRSTSTRENAVFSAELLAKTSGTLVLLTSDYHMRRARACFAAAGVQIRPVPVPDALKRYQRPLNRWWVFTDLVTETLKLAGYKLRGWC